VVREPGCKISTIPNIFAKKTTKEENLQKHAKYV